MVIDRTVDRPLYTQLKESILSEVKQGLLKPGDRLPSHRELGQHFQVSHMTVRRAIMELTDEGVIYAVPGKGIYVAEPKQEADAGPLISFHDDMARRGLVPSTRTLEAYVTSASSALAQIMGLEPNAPLIYMRRLFLADEMPIALSTTYLPRQLCRDLLSQELIGGSLFATLRHTYGLRLAKGRRTAEAVMADQTQADLLGLTLPNCLLLIEQLTFTDAGQVVVYDRMFYRGDRYRVSVSQ